METPSIEQVLDAAQALIDQEAVAEALALLREARQQGHETPELLMAMANCLELLDRNDEAVAMCNQVIAAQPLDEAFVLKARLLTTPADTGEEAGPLAPLNTAPLPIPVLRTQESPAQPPVSPLSIHTGFVLAGLLAAVGAAVAGMALNTPAAGEFAHPALRPAATGVLFLIMNLCGAWAVALDAWWRRPGTRWEAPLSLLDDALPAALLMSLPGLGPLMTPALLHRKTGWDSALNAALLLAVVQLLATGVLLATLHR